MTEAPAFQLSRWVSLRLLGVTYLLAFASLTPQVLGLVGTEGLLPIGDFLDRAREFYGEQAYDFSGPTLTLFDIARHWDLVAERIETFDRLEGLG